MSNEFFTREELARQFKVSVHAVSKWASTGKVRIVHTPGGAIRYQLIDPREDRNAE